MSATVARTIAPVGEEIGAAAAHAAHAEALAVRRARPSLSRSVGELVGGRAAAGRSCAPRLRSARRRASARAVPPAASARAGRRRASVSRCGASCERTCSSTARASRSRHRVVLHEAAVEADDAERQRDRPLDAPRVAADGELEAPAAEVERRARARCRARRAPGARGRSRPPPPRRRGCAPACRSRSRCGARLRHRCAPRGAPRCRPACRRSTFSRRATSQSARPTSTARSATSSGDRAAVRDRRAEPEHHLLLHDRADLAARGRVGDQQVEGRAAEVERRHAHDGRLLGRREAQLALRVRLGLEVGRASSACGRSPGAPRSSPCGRAGVRRGARTRRARRSAGCR